MDSSPSVVLASGGEIKLPVGFRFRPTDEELLVHYLKRKVLSAPLSAVVIPELDVFQTDPQSLPGDLRETRHFFSKRAEQRNSIRKRKCGGAAIRDGSGRWKLAGKEKRIVASGSSQVIGTKRNLVFCEGKGFDSTKPRWTMHELRLSVQTTSDWTRSENKMIPPAVENGGGEWAVYRVFQKRRKQPKSDKKATRIVPVHRPIAPTPTVIDFRNEAENLMGIGSDSVLPPPPPSPCSSSSTRDSEE